MAATMEAAMFIMFNMHACVCAHACACMNVCAHVHGGGAPTQPYSHTTTHPPPGGYPPKSVKT